MKFPCYAPWSPSHFAGSSSNFTLKVTPMRHAKSAFTLVELLVVIAIIGVLVSLVMPSFRAAKETAIALNCMSRARGFMTYIEQYRQEYRLWYPSNLTTGGNPGMFTGSFETLITPYVPPFRAADMPYTQPRCIIPTLNPFICPTATPPAVYDANNQRLQGWLEGGIYGNYRINSYFGYGAAGAGTTNEVNRKCKRDVFGPTSTMVLIGEWRSASTYFGDLNRVNFCIYRHADVSNLVFADGHGKGYKDIAAEISAGTLRTQQ
jgi:prepilin-type N-terminal cleavage/methylation domain-containing protein/prepilin-type processing-associated H-X9-DG protein